MILCDKCKLPTHERLILGFQTQSVVDGKIDNLNVFSNKELCAICKSELINQMQFAVAGFFTDRPLLTKEELYNAGHLLKEACDLLVYYQTSNAEGFKIHLQAFEDQMSARGGGRLIDELRKPGAMTASYQGKVNTREQVLGGKIDAIERPSSEDRWPLN